MTMYRACAPFLEGVTGATRVSQVYVHSLENGQNDAFVPTA